MSADRFYEGLYATVSDTLRLATEALREEQKENARLRATIAEYPPTCWELKERVTMLETQIKNWGINPATPPRSPIVGA